MSHQAPADPAPPHCPTVELPPLVAGQLDDLRSRALLEAVELLGVQGAEVRLTDATLDGCRLVDLHTPTLRLEGSSLRDVVLHRPDVALVQAWSTRWRDVHLDAGRLGAVDAYESDWGSVRLSGVKLTYLNLRGSQVADLLLEHCRLDTLDLNQAQVRRLCLIDCQVDTLDVRAATLSDVDLRGAHLSTIEGLPDLRGATISSLQLQQLAGLLAHHLGLRVEEV